MVRFSDLSQSRVSLSFSSGTLGKPIGKFLIGVRYVGCSTLELLLLLAEDSLPLSENCDLCISKDLSVLRLDDELLRLLSGERE